MAEYDENRNTFLKDKWGYKMWVQMLFAILVMFGVVLFVAGLVTGVSVIQDKHEVQVFNRMHGTDYTWQEWFWTESTIKEYIIGPVENQNYQVDLNIKGLKGGVE